MPETRRGSSSTGPPKSPARGKKSKAKKQQEQSQEEKAKLERAVAAQALELDCLKQKYNMALAKAAENSGRAPPRKKLKGGKNSMTAEERRTHSMTRKGLKKAVWGFKVFVASMAVLLAVTQAVAQHVEPPELDIKDEDEKAAKMKEWVEDHKDVVLYEVNNIRNYTQSQIRELMEAEIGAEDGFTMEELKKCAYRDAEFLATERGEEALDFYHDKFLFKLGAKELWDTKYRHQFTITNAKLPKCGCHKDGRVCISEDLEAFGVLLLENAWKKWSTVVLEKKNQGSKFKFDPKAEYAQCPYTDSLNGGSKWGGWNGAGRSRFRDIRTMVKEGRNKETTPMFEQATLDRLR